MTWRLRIEHVSGYRYKTPVQASYNEARITPLTTMTQTTIDSRVDIAPASRPYRYWDYWGTLVHAFDIHVPHVELVVTGSSTVETKPAPPLPTGVGWDNLEGDASERWEFLTPTDYVPLSEDLAGIANEFRSCAQPVDAAVAASAWVRDAMAYVPGTTGVSTSAEEALATRQGVCQDFVHVFAGIMRSLGVPTRYVSGYLHPAKEPALGVAVKGQSHAWAEVWVGEWTAVDPTNGLPPGQRHVSVARGRDYRDVSPLKGIYSGGAAHALEVEVELTRIA